eukprot:80323-Alexandrium_andersonii.AAC.1
MLLVVGKRVDIGGSPTHRFPSTGGYLDGSGSLNLGDEASMVSGSVYIWPSASMATTEGGRNKDVIDLPMNSEAMGNVVTSRPERDEGAGHLQSDIMKPASEECTAP